MIRQTVLSFKLEKTNDLITPHAGLALLGEFTIGLGLLKSLDQHLPKPGSGVGYDPSEHLFPLILMLNGGGRSLEGLRQIRNDLGLRELLGRDQRLYIGYRRNSHRSREAISPLDLQNV